LKKFTTFFSRLFRKAAAEVKIGYRCSCRPRKNWSKASMTTLVMVLPLSAGVLVHPLSQPAGRVDRDLLGVVGALDRMGIGRSW
jgi:hypothetical protein